MSERLTPAVRRGIPSPQLLCYPVNLLMGVKWKSSQTKQQFITAIALMF